MSSNMTQKTLSSDFEGYQEQEIRTYKLNGDLSKRTYSQTRILKHIVEAATYE